MNTKQVLIIRRDLKMRRGKEIAQGSHASMAFLTEKAQYKGLFSFWIGLFLLIWTVIKIWFHKPSRQWLQSSYAKVTCRVDSEADLNLLHEAAKKLGVKSKLIIDSGRTEFNGVPTPTALALGPDESDKIDQISGEKGPLGRLELY